MEHLHLFELLLIFYTIGYSSGYIGLYINIILIHLFIYLLTKISFHLFSFYKINTDKFDVLFLFVNKFTLNWH